MKNIVKTLIVCAGALFAASCVRDNTSLSSGDVIQTLYVKDVFSDEAIAQAQLLHTGGVLGMGFQLQQPDNTSKMFPTDDIDENNIFRQYIDGLESETKYTITPYVIMNSGDYIYGSPVTFRTNNSLIKYVTLGPVSVPDTTGRSFLVSGYVANMGNDARVYQYGVTYWPKSDYTQLKTIKVVPNPAIEIIEAGQAFSVDVTGLLPNTTYQFQLFAANSRKPKYADVLEVKTKEVFLPAVEMVSVGEPGITNAELKVRLLYDGNDPETVVGVYYKGGSYGEERFEFNIEGVEEVGTPTPYLFTDIIKKLHSSTVYTFQAFAKNYAGETRSENSIVAPETKPAGKPQLMTFPIVDNRGVEAVIATIGGEVVSNGDRQLNDYGFKVGTDQNSLSKTKATSYDEDSGLMSLDLTGLSPNTLYYYQAYAVNSFEEGTGDILSFRTAVDGGVLKVGRKKSGAGTVVDSDIRLFYFELDPIDIRIPNSPEGENADSTDLKIYFLDRNLGARKPFPKPLLDGATFNEDGSVMTAGEWTAWYGGYFFKWDRKDPKLTPWLWPDGEDEIRPWSGGEYSGNEAAQKTNCGFQNDNNNANNSQVYIGGLKEWLPTNDPCPAGYRIPTAFEWQAVSRAFAKDLNPGYFPRANVDLDYLHQKLKLGVAGDRNANGVPGNSSKEETGTSGVGSITFAGYLWSSTPNVRSIARSFSSTPKPTDMPVSIPLTNWTIQPSANEMGIVYAPTTDISFWQSVGRDFPVDPEGKYTASMYYDPWLKFGMYARAPWLATPIRCVRTAAQ